MSKWNHSICDECWRKREPTRIPHRGLPELTETVCCCFCGNPTRSGILVRESPDAVLCKGECEAYGKSIE
jgi:hypothetical protein